MSLLVDTCDQLHPPNSRLTCCEQRARAGGSVRRLFKEHRNSESRFWILTRQNRQCRCSVAAHSHLMPLFSLLPTRTGFSVLAALLMQQDWSI